MATLQITMHDNTVHTLRVPSDYRPPFPVGKDWLEFEGVEGSLTMHPGVIKAIFVKAD